MGVGMRTFLSPGSECRHLSVAMTLRVEEGASGSMAMTRDLGWHPSRSPGRSAIPAHIG